MQCSQEVNIHCSMLLFDNCMHVSVSIITCHGLPCYLPMSPFTPILAEWLQKLSYCDRKLTILV